MPAPDSSKQDSDFYPKTSAFTPNGADWLFNMQWLK